VINTLSVVRRPRRRTHLVLGITNPFSMQTICNITVPARGSDGVTSDMAGGATERLISFLRKHFNDDTCCKRCTASAALIVAIYRSRDNGLRSA
jgi:hypothetical protein